MSAIAHSQNYPPHWITPQKQLEQLGQFESALSRAITNTSPLFQNISNTVTNYTYIIHASYACAAIGMTAIGTLKSHQVDERSAAITLAATKTNKIKDLLCQFQ
jgi:hypothetical protein